MRWRLGHTHIEGCMNRRSVPVCLLAVPVLLALLASCSGGASASTVTPSTIAAIAPPTTTSTTTPPAPNASGGAADPATTPTSADPTTLAPAIVVTEPTSTESTTTVGPTTVPATDPATDPATTVAATTVVESTVPVETTTTLAPNVEVVGPFATPLVAVGGSSGENTKFIQLRLAQLGFWNSGTDGQYGLTTKQAVMAFQKYLGLDPTGKVDDATAAYMTNVTERAHGAADTGTLVEIDKAKQLLYVIVDGKTQWVFNTSTGNGQPYIEDDKNTPGEKITGVALTPEGLFKTNRERPEGWWEGDLGQIYRPKYFRGGIAVHGSNSIPNYPASHGCVRVSVPAMDFIWASGLVPLGTTVWVHVG